MTAATTLRRVTPTAHLVLPADASREQWLQARRRGLGSSDIAAVLGLSRHGTARHVYYDKLGRLPLEDDAGEPALWGTLHEETVAREWARRNHTVVRRVGLVANVDRPWAMCTLDRRCTECPLAHDVRESCAVEVKTRDKMLAGQWRRGTPDDVLAQVLWQIIVTGYGHLHVAVLIGGNDYRQFVVRRRDYEDVIADILTAADRLWNEHVLRGVPPELTGDEPADALIDLYGSLYPQRDGVIRLDDEPDVFDDLRDYEEYRLAEADARKRKNAAKARLLARLKGAEVAVLDSDLAYSYEVSLRRTPDLERLAEGYPEAYEECVVDKPSRRLNIGPTYRLKEVL